MINNIEDDFYINCFEKLKIEIKKEQIDKLKIYENLLIENNRKFNLTAITKKEEIWNKHFYDSVNAFLYLSSQNTYKLADVGTGAGFPGIVLKIINPNIDLYLIESNRKKIEFLKQVISALNLNKVYLIDDRVENLPTKYFFFFDYFIYRAVTSIKVMCELVCQLLKINGCLISMKSVNWVSEIKESANFLKNLGYDKSLNFEYKLLDNSYRILLINKKTKKTDKKYPRKYSQIIKNYS